jgi:predicted MFS family arabinose efflux permease
MALLALLVPHLPEAVFRIGMVICFAGYMLTTGVVAAVWFEWLAQLFKPAIRGTVFGVCWCLSSLLAAGGGLLAGHLIKAFPGHGVFSFLYFLGGVISLSVWIPLVFLDEQNLPKPEKEENQPSGLRRRFQGILSDPEFKKFLIARLLATSGFCIVPFIALNYASSAGGGLSEGTLVSCGVAITAATALTNLILGRLGDKRGHRIGLMVGVCMQIVTLVIMLTTQGFWSCILTYAGAGVYLGSGAISHYNMLIEYCPDDNPLGHIMIGNVIIGIGVLISSVLAGIVASQWGLKVLFTLSLALSIFALVWLAALVKDPRVQKQFLTAPGC